MKDENKTYENLPLCKIKVFEKVFESHSALLYNYIYYKCGDADMSHDLVQEAFVKLWENCKKVLFLKAKAFVFTVAKNLLFNQFEHQKVKLKYQQSISDELNNENPQFLLEEAEFRDLLNEAIANLPEKQRVVFLLNRIDKKTYAEIADLLGVSVKAIEKRMHNALISLRKKVKNI